ncbi:hypothetical protein (nucleomorph) [Guillardia theta]|uniref:TIP49 P-loop domain-containing protein n=1 Tax=Guillardia theta TaxID=55529 RepID=Q98RS5_GUITH|nr:hypothetical protein GTHECHR1080 [Guillardia theta]AAK39872.1 hypothetical protein [Guillardia theta]
MSKFFIELMKNHFYTNKKLNFLFKLIKTFQTEGDIILKISFTDNESENSKSLINQIIKKFSRTCPIKILDSSEIKKKLLKKNSFIREFQNCIGIETKKFLLYIQGKIIQIINKNNNDKIVTIYIIHNDQGLKIKLKKKLWINFNKRKPHVGDNIIINLKNSEIFIVRNKNKLSFFSDNFNRKLFSLTRGKIFSRKKIIYRYSIEDLYLPNNLNPFFKNDLCFYLKKYFHTSNFTIKKGICIINNAENLDLKFLNKLSIFKEVLLLPILILIFKNFSSKKKKSLLRYNCNDFYFLNFTFNFENYIHRFNLIYITNYFLKKFSIITPKLLNLLKQRNLTTILLILIDYKFHNNNNIIIIKTKNLNKIIQVFYDIELFKKSNNSTMKRFIRTNV